MNQEPGRRGKLVVIRGPMFAGKTTELMRRARMASASGRIVRIIKPRRDTRYAHGEIVTHSGVHMGATPVESAGGIVCTVDGVGHVLIDEAHFFGDSLALVVDELLARGVDVTVAGVDLDHRGALFEPFGALGLMVGEVVGLTAVCSVCGGAAMYTQRMTGGAERIVVGGAEMYEPRCAKCFVPCA
ncbi:MAG TPA: hypothetical protein VK176_08925 [Phycisphaerales bacterium]|nr:hypothetical protein [Phycisphaerales bacterium]